MNFAGSLLVAFFLSRSWAAPNSPREKTPQNDDLLTNHEGFMAWFGLVGDDFSPLQGRQDDKKKKSGVASEPIQAPTKDSTPPRVAVSHPLPHPHPHPHRTPYVNPHANDHSNDGNRERSEPKKSKVNSGERKPSSTIPKRDSSPKTGQYPNSYLRPPPLSRPSPQETGPRRVQGQRERSPLTGYLGKPNPSRPKPGQPNQGQPNPTRQTAPVRRPSWGRRIPSRPSAGQKNSNRLGLSRQGQNQPSLGQEYPSRPWQSRPRQPQQPQQPRQPVRQTYVPSGGLGQQYPSRPRKSQPRQLTSQMYGPSGHPRYRPPHQHNSFWRRPRHPPTQNWKATRPNNAAATRVISYACSAEGKSGICVIGKHDCKGVVLSGDKKFICGSPSYKCCPRVSRAEIIRYQKLPFAITYPGSKCGHPGGEIGRCQEMILECGTGKEASGRCRNSANTKCCTKSTEVPSP